MSAPDLPVVQLGAAVFYHAARCEVPAPDPKQWAKRNRWMANGNCVLGLFASSVSGGLDAYGDRLHQFTLAADAVVLDVPDEFTDARRCNQFYYGIKLFAERLGAHALRVDYGDGMARLVVMDFSKIEHWTAIDWPPEG